MFYSSYLNVPVNLNRPWRTPEIICSISILKYGVLYKIRLAIQQNIYQEPLDWAAEIFQNDGNQYDVQDLNELAMLICNDVMHIAYTIFSTSKYTSYHNNSNSFNNCNQDHIYKKYPKYFTVYVKNMFVSKPTCAKTIMNIKLGLDLPTIIS